MTVDEKDAGGAAQLNLASFEKDGFAIIDNVLPPDLFEAAKNACQKAVERGREGGWPYLRIVGKVFPPWPPSGPDIWGIQHLMHPDLGLPIFKQIYTDPKLLSAACTILAVPSPLSLQLELLNLLVNPHTTQFSLPYHRDTIPAGTPADEEAKMLARPRTGTQYNLALYDDDCLIVVPGSHRRPKTAEEARVLAQDDKTPLKDEIRVLLKPNQAVFFDNDILHRAEYNPSQHRATFHGCMGVEGQIERARMVLQHGVEYLKQESFADGMDAVGQKMWRNLMEGYGRSSNTVAIHDI
ncbi:hypothetical protein ABW20_dc0108781 [Dactylellina cionopaga]|nr:hypothetical protein ABW20_dc0108781 [Dactylellina cionopaga]